MLSASEARQLDRLALGGTAATASVSASGARVGRARGFGSEFHDFRHYQPGDDPRDVAWTIYARLGQLVVRTFRADAHLRVHLLVDVSRSMTAGEPEKLACAKKLAALLCYAGVRQRDAVGVATFDDRIEQHVPPTAGRPQLFRVFEALRATPPGRASSISRALIGYGGAARGPGLAIVMSDFYDPAGAFEGLRYLLHRGLTPALIQVVAPDEIDPRVAGEIELTDIEDPAAEPIAVDPALVAAYQARMAALTASLGEFCATHGLPWLQVRSSGPFAAWLRGCQQAGLLARRG
jgi:uncharacterized protein (DUF58 family)